jgi:hypothetical protein
MLRLNATTLTSARIVGSGHPIAEGGSAARQPDDATLA